MFSLNTRVDGFRFRFPKTFIAEQLREKYGQILNNYRGFYQDPIEFLNESVKNVDVLGLNDGTISQQQTGRGLNYFSEKTKMNNYFKHMSTETPYRSPDNPLNLIDKTLVIKFRHTLGYLNYFMLFENFFYQYSRDYEQDKLDNVFNVELLGVDGTIISKIVIDSPLMFGIDSLSFDYAKPTAENQEFTATFKYANVDYQFVGSIEEQFG